MDSSQTGGRFAMNGRWRSDFLAYSLGDVRLNPEYPSKYSLLNLASQSDHVLPLTITVGDVAKMMIRVWRCLGAATRSSSNVVYQFLCLRDWSALLHGDEVRTIR